MKDFSSNILNIRKIKLYNKKDIITEITKYFDGIIPSWLIDINFNDISYYIGKEENCEYIWKPFDLKSGNPDYSIYYTIVNKVDYIEYLIQYTRKCRTSYSKIIRKKLIEWQDQFQMLMIYIQYNNKYSNEDLLIKFDEYTDISTFSMLHPRESLAFTIESLPDLFVHIFYCNFWETKCDAFPNNIEMKIIEILNKIQPATCKGRSLSNIISKKWKEENGEYIFDITLRVIFAGLLGVYEHGTVETNFHVRSLLYRWFCFENIDKTHLETWITKNKLLTIYIFKEFFFFLLKRNSAFEQFMKDTYYWDEIKQNSVKAMDKVRTILNTNMSNVFEHDNLNHDSIFFGIEEQLADFNKKNSKLSYRHINLDFYTKIKDIIWKIEIDKELNQNYIENIDCELEKTKIEEIVNTYHNPLQPLSYEWINFYNVSLINSILPLKEAERLYRSQTDKTKIRKVLEKILEDSFRDYELLKTFFLAMYKKNAIVSICKKNGNEVKKISFKLID